jgi:hypothetical protein
MFLGQPCPVDCEPEMELKFLYDIRRNWQIFGCHNNGVLNPKVQKQQSTGYRKIIMISSLSR